MVRYDEIDLSGTKLYIVLGINSLGGMALAIPIDGYVLGGSYCPFIYIF